mmetsp:Transcript_4405/g.6054  ORF Transcript_4405/g.6054 Transcript_4405/m.6054 type:complete len:89 (-) Transcript_4405:7-273(-)
MKYCRLSEVWNGSVTFVRRNGKSRAITGNPTNKAKCSNDSVVELEGIGISSLETEFKLNWNSIWFEKGCKQTGERLFSLPLRRDKQEI